MTTKNPGSSVIIANKRVAVTSNTAMTDVGMVNTHYDENINMYTEPPQNTISLHEFYSVALNRLQVLKKIEFMHDSNSEEEAIRDTIHKMTVGHRIAVEAKKNNKTGVVSTMNAEDRAEFRENDNISHFICRLAYCRNEELRKWFITQETRLFSQRIAVVNPSTIKQLLEKKCDIIYEQLLPSDDVWNRFEKQITFKSETGAYREGGARLPSDFVKVPFKEAISLVGRRAVFLHMGIAYVPMRELL